MANPRLAFPALLSSIAVLASAPAAAICGSPRIFTSGEAYVVTAGCEPADCGSAPSSVTDDLEGFFWGIGEGDVRHGVGIDSGIFAPLDGWVETFPDYPAVINSTWAASTQIDSCIDFAENPAGCMSILLMDRHPDSGDGQFALVTLAPDALGNFAYDGSGDIGLVPLVRPIVTATQRLDENRLQVLIDGISVGDIEAGLYLHPTCFGGVRGYRLFVARRPLDSPQPEDSRAELWEPLPDLLPLGAPGVFVVDCSVQESLWLRAGLEFDSGFSSVYLSGSSTRIECSQTLAEPEDPQPRKPRSRERPRERKPRN